MAAFDPLTDFIQLPPDSTGKKSAYVDLGNGLYVPGTVLATADGNYVDTDNPLWVTLGISGFSAENDGLGAANTLVVSSLPLVFDGAVWRRQVSANAADATDGLGVPAAGLMGWDGSQWNRAYVDTAGSVQTQLSIRYLNILDVPTDGYAQGTLLLDDGVLAAAEGWLGLTTSDRNLVFNGTSWDRARGDAADGAWVNVKASVAIPVLLAPGHVSATLTTADDAATFDTANQHQWVVVTLGGASGDFAGVVAFEQSYDGVVWRELTLELDSAYDGAFQHAFAHASPWSGGTSDSEASAQEIWHGAVRARHVRVRLSVASAGSVVADVRFSPNAGAHQMTQITGVGGVAAVSDGALRTESHLYIGAVPAKSALDADATVSADDGSGILAVGTMLWDGATWRAQVYADDGVAYTRAPAVGVMTFNGGTLDRIRDAPRAAAVGDGKGVIAAGMIGLDGGTYRPVKVDNAGVLVVGDGGSAISVDDDGGSLTVDGTFWQATQPVSGPLTDAQLRATAVPVSGSFTVDSLTSADLDTGAGTDTRAVVGLALAASGGALLVGSANPMPISDNGGSLTVDGTFFQATQPVSIAATVAVGDGGGSLTVDGTFWQATQPVSGTVTANAGSGPFPVSDNSGSLTVDAPVATPVFVRLSDGSAAITTLPVSGPLTDAQLRATAVPVSGTVAISGSVTTTADTELTTADLDTGAGTDTRAVVGLAGAASGGAVLVGATAGGLLKVDGSGAIQPVSGTFWQGTQPVSIASAVPVTDNSGSLTVDAPVATPVFVRLSDGSAAITTLPVSIATAVPVTDNSGSLTVDNSGTFAVQAAVAGDVASAATDSGNPVKVGAKFLTTPPTFTDGQRGDLMMGTRGSLNVTLFGQNNATPALITSLADATGGQNSLYVGAFSMVWNGATWDRMREAPSADGQARAGLLAAALMGFNGTTYDRLLSDTTNGLDVDVTRVSGTVTVGQGTGTNLHTVLDSGTLSTITNVVHVDDNSGSLTVDAPVGTPLFARLSDGAAALIGQKAMTASLPVVLASDQASIPVAATLAAETVKVIGTVNQGTSPWVVSNTVLSVVGSGTEATAQRVTIATDSTGVLSVDDGGGSLTVDGTGTFAAQVTRGPIPATATLSNVADNASSTTVLASNGSRMGATVYNDSAAALYLKLGTTASVTSFTVKMNQNDYYEVPYGYTGRIDGIWASAPGGAARVTEVTA